MFVAIKENRRHFEKQIWIWAKLTLPDLTVTDMEN